MDSSEKRLVRSNDTVGNLWRFYEEHASQARQHENLRATVVSILSSIAAAVVALVGVGGINHADIPASVVVILLGLLGVALGIKHYERNRMHTEVMGAVRCEITRLDQDPGASPKSTQVIRNEAEACHNETFVVWPWGKKTRGTDSRCAGPKATDLSQQRTDKTFWARFPLHILWLLLPLAIALLGLVVFSLSFVGVPAK
jgi:disulfide bond formation protein DsbB